MSWRADGLLVAMGAVLSAFFSGAETGAYVISRLRLRYRAREEGLAWAKTLERLLDDMPVFVTATLVWTNLSLFLVSSSCTSLYARSGLDIHPEIAATLTAAPILFIFAELVPKNLFLLRSERLMASSARALSIAVLVVRPFARALSTVGRPLGRALGLPEPRHWALVSRGAFRAQFAAGASAGALTLPQRELVENIMQAGTRSVLEAGTPAERVPAFPEDSTAGELVARAHDCGATRVLIYRDRRDEAVGVVHVIRAWGAPPGTPLSELAREPVWLDEGSSIIQALVALRRAGRTVGIVAAEPGPADEGGGSGRRARAVVSVEQLVGHLVGRRGGRRSRA